MDSLDAIAATLLGQWDAKVVETLLLQARFEETRTAFEAIRISEGLRLAVCVCACEPSVVELLDDAFTDAAIVDEDWTAFSLRNFFRVTLDAGGPCKMLQPGAMALMVARPDSITRLEAVLRLPE